MISAVKLKPACLLAAIVLIVALGLSHKSLKAENARLRQTAAAAQNEVETLRSTLNEQLDALMKREAERACLAARTARQQQELRNIYAEDTEAGAWGSDGIPAAVLECLRR